MKEIPFEDSNTLETALQEKKLMSRVSHKHICKYIDSFVGSGNKLYLIMEYCERGDLHQYLDRLKKMNQLVVAGSVIKSPKSTECAIQTNIGSTSSALTELGEYRTWRFFLQICLALEVIHDKGIVHADIKP